ncbi:MAG: GMC family oxidoreductase N-terminal domain-containing protein [Anaerolineae bacterium]|nr:GMC family oxidoreductase N-terminal domain-containing protein [Anaerolineae bacterium]
MSQTSDSVFTARQMEVLRLVCDTLAPALAVELPDPHGLYARSASAMNVPARIAEILQAVAPERLDQIRLVLDALAQPLANALLSRQWRSIFEMDLHERTALLRAWADSPIDLQRRVFSTFKRLTLLLFYADADQSGNNPNWAAIGYPRPALPPSGAPKPLRPLQFTEDTTLETDVVIVGSGAGGSVLAAELSRAGLDVVVLEKGGYYAEPDFDGYEVRSQARMFEKGGFMVSEDLGMMILAGSTLGGGTTINWAASLRTPDHVLAEWARDYGVDFTDGTFARALDTVSERIHVTEAESAPNPRNAVLVRGAEALGYTVKVIPRNVRDCADCGACGFGCAHGAKQSALKTYLQDAYECGARLAIGVHVDRVLIEDGVACGVEGTARAENGQTVRLTVHARAVAVCAGALHTPALLLRSGLTNAHIGRNLHLHPSTGAFGFYAEPINGWSGVMMSHYVPQFNNLDGHGYGVTLESAPGHAGLAAVALPWQDGLQHKQLMERYAHMANVLIITRDRDGGAVRLKRDGSPAIFYRLSAHDRAHLLRGVIEALRIHYAAGAEQIVAPHHRVSPYQRGEGDFEAWLGQVAKAGLPSNAFILGSAHQMSSCRMAANPARGAIAPDGETFEVRNLFVADGSALPTASGVNPMLTIMAVAHIVAQHIKTRLC